MSFARELRFILSLNKPALKFKRIGGYLCDDFHKFSKSNEIRFAISIVHIFNRASNYNIPSPSILTLRFHSSMISVMDQKNKVGRPRKINQFIARKIFLLAKYGLTDEQIGEVLGISHDTIDREKKNPEFCVSLKEAKDIADLAVANALYHRAIGYSYPEEKVFNNNGEIIRVTVNKHCLPDTTACIFWLKNRRPNEWQEKPLDKQDDKMALNLISIFKAAKDHTGVDPVEEAYGKR